VRKADPGCRRQGPRAGAEEDSRTNASPSSSSPASVEKADRAAFGPEPAKLTHAETLRELADRANRGDAHALTNLRRLLDSCPEIWQRVGDLARHAELAWLDLLSGTDCLLAESAKRQIARMKEDLAGPDPTPRERLLVDRVVACYLGVQHAEMRLAAAGDASASAIQITLRQRGAEGAQRRYLAALKTLARLRAVMPAGLVPIKSLRLYDAARQQA